jgi:hypothetical protein
MNEQHLYLRACTLFATAAFIFLLCTGSVPVNISRATYQDRKIPLRAHIRDIQLIIQNKEAQPITDLSVIFQSTTSDVNYTFQKDIADSSIYAAKQVIYGIYDVRISSGGKLLLSDTINLLQPRTAEIQRSIPITIGDPGDAYTYRQGFKYPYIAQPGVAGISFLHKNKKQVWKLCQQLGFTVPSFSQFTGVSPAEDNAIYITLSKKKGLSAIHSPELKALRESPFVLSAGPLIQTGKGSQQRTVILSTTIYVGYSSVYASQLADFCQKHRLTIQPATFALDTYHFIASPEVGYSVLDIVRQLNQMDSIVAYANPSF